MYMYVLGLKSISVTEQHKGSLQFIVGYHQTAGNDKSSVQIFKQLEFTLRILLKSTLKANPKVIKPHSLDL